jgi:hypothetical protein
MLYHFWYVSMELNSRTIMSCFEKLNVQIDDHMRQTDFEKT